MAVTKKIKSISLNHCSLSCHELARPAYVVSKDLEFQIHIDQLPQEFIILSQVLEPVHVVEVSSKKYEFFAGWQWFDVCCTNHVSKISIIVHKEISRREILKLAWAYQLSKHSCDLHRESNLTQLTTLIDKMPLDIRKDLLLDYHSYSALQTTSLLTNESRSAIRNQLGKTKRIDIEPHSVLNELLGNN
jgi:hypothetical protein